MPQGYIYTWTGKVSSNYNKAGNWYNDTAGTTAGAPPGSNDEAIISTAGNVTGPGSAFELGLTGTGSGLSVAGTLYANYAYVGGIVTLAAGAALGSPNLIDIGDNSSGVFSGKVGSVFTVGANSFINATSSVADTFDVIVGQGGGSGTLAVSGGIASAGTEGFWVGNGGSGDVSVTNGGLIESGTTSGSGASQIDLALGSNGGSGRLSVSGSTSLAYFTNTVEVGFGGAGLLTVTQGGTFDAGDGSNSLNIGDSYNGGVGSGVVTVDASTAYLAGIIEVGGYGQGSLALSDGAVVYDYFNKTSPTSAWSALIGANPASSGTLSLTSSSTMLAAEGIAVGSQGTGELSVSASTLSILAAAASGTVAMVAGLESGSVGTVNVSGGLINDQGLAGMIIGELGTGAMSITNLGNQGGAVITGSATGGVGFTVGSGGGSNGAVRVSGVGAALEVHGELDDGVSGSGTITVSESALLTAGVSGTLSGMVLGGNGGNGALSVATDAQAVITGQTDVGDLGDGTMSVTGGAGLVVNAIGLPAIIVGLDSGSFGTVLVSDKSSYFVATGGIEVGVDGSGAMTVQNQAYAEIDANTEQTNPVLIIGASADAVGTLSVTSMSNMVVNGPGINVGDAGQGLLSIGNGSLTINAASAAGANAIDVGVLAGASGTVNVSGGLLNDTQSSGMVIGDAGTGTLTIDQSGTQSALVLAGGSSEATGLALGLGAGSRGGASLSGAASTLGVAGEALIGSDGVGSLSVASGAHFDAYPGPSSTGLVLGGSFGTGVMSMSGGALAYVIGQTIVGDQGAGVVSVTGGSSFTGTTSNIPVMVLGNESTAVGSMLVTGSASYESLRGGIIVGNSGSGSLDVDATATLVAWGYTGSNLVGLVVGQNDGSQGTVTVSAGAQILAQTSVVAGLFGNGTIDVSTGTLMISVSPATGVSALSVGTAVGSSGVVNVSGGFIDDTESAGMVIGDTGAGSLSISQSGAQGGLVLTGGVNGAAGLLVGVANGVTGGVSVNGTASALGVAGAAIVGNSGTGIISLTDGGHFDAYPGSTAVGLLLGNSGGVGSLSLAGGSQAYVIGQTVVGRQGTGSLSVTGGSSFTGTTTGIPGLVIGQTATGTGSVLFSGTNSYMSLSGGLQVGAAGYGTFTVADGAVAQNSGSLSIGVHGTVVTTGAGSTLNSDAATNLGTIVLTSGTLSFLGAVSGNGSIVIAASGTVILGSTETNAIGFGSGGGVIDALLPADVGGIVSGWSENDVIDLKDTSATSDSFANGTLTLLGAANSSIGSIVFAGSLASHNFSLSLVSGDGTEISYHS